MLTLSMWVQRSSSAHSAKQTSSCVPLSSTDTDRQNCSVIPLQFIVVFLLWLYTIISSATVLNSHPPRLQKTIHFICIWRICKKLYTSHACYAIILDAWLSDAATLNFNNFLRTFLNYIICMHTWHEVSGTWKKYFMNTYFLFTTFCLFATPLLLLYFRCSVSTNFWMRC